MEASFFGDSSRPLFGVTHPPEGAPSRRNPVLVCGPTMHEGVRSHRLIRQLCRQLSRQGFYVMRFDYSGEGDSAGSGGAEGCVKKWSDDIAVAAQELRDVSGLNELILIGIRMGAPLLLRSSFRGARIGEVILWDPIVSGSRYVETCVELHKEMLQDPMRFAKPRTGRKGELLGFPVTEKFISDVQEIDLLQGGGVVEPGELPASSFCIISSDSDAEQAKFATHLNGQGASATHKIVEDTPGWDSLSEIENLVAVGPALRAIVERAKEVSS